jgi:UDP-glucose 4-epimerase
VIEGYLAGAAKPGIEGATIDLGSGGLVSIRGIVERLVAIVDRRIEPLFGAVPDRPGENEIAANTAVALASLGWSATTSLETGLRQTVEWYRSAAQSKRT